MFKVWLAQAEEPSTWDGELVVGSYTPNLRYLVAYAANLNAPGVLTYDEIRIVQGLP